MKKIRCVINSKEPFTDKFNGQEVIVTHVSARCEPWDFSITCKLIKPFECDGKTWHEINLYSSDVEVIDKSDIPKTHIKSLVLQNAWVFATARNDAWYKGPPHDPIAYEKNYGMPWKDERVYDIGMK